MLAFLKKIPNGIWTYKSHLFRISSSRECKKWVIARLSGNYEEINGVKIHIRQFKLFVSTSLICIVYVISIISTANYL